MSSRIIIWLLCAAAVALACVPRVRSADTASADTVIAAASPASGSQDDSPVASTLNVAVDGSVSLHLHVTNRSERQVEFVFPSGQTHDFAVFDSAGREVWRWSEGRMFTQVLQSRVLAARETASYEERWDPSGQVGQFTAVASLRSSTQPVEERLSFTLP